MPTTKKTRPTPSKPRSTATRPSSTRQPPGEGDIALRAYELFIQRGGEHGRDMEDWLMAKRELSLNS